MKQFRIYISSSKQSNSTEFNDLFNYLRKEYPFAIVERFLGGRYSTDQLREAHAVFVVPPMDRKVLADDERDNDFICLVGRGGFDESQLAIGEMDVPCYLYENGEYYVVTGHKEYESKKDWGNAYGYLLLNQSAGEDITGGYQLAEFNSEDANIDPPEDAPKKPKPYEKF